MAERPWKFESSRPHHLTPVSHMVHHPVMAGAPSDAATPKRKLGLVMCVALVVGSMIGSGVFLLPTSLAPLGWNSVYG